VVNVKIKEHFSEVFFVLSRKKIIAGFGLIAAAAAVLGLLTVQSMYELTHFSLF